MLESNNDFKVLVQNVSYLRKSKGLTKQQLATAAGMSVKTITLLEQGIVGKRFGVTQIFCLAEVLGCAPAALFLPSHH